MRHNNLPREIPDVPKPDTPQSFEDMEDAYMALWETQNEIFIREIKHQELRLSELQQELINTRDQAAALLQLIYEKKIFTRDEWSEMCTRIQVKNLQEKLENPDD